MNDKTAGLHKYMRVTAWAGAVIAAALAVYGLKITKIVSMPIVFSVLAVMLVHPLQLSVSSKLPRKLRWVGIVAAMLAIVTALLLFLGGIWFASEELVQGFPEYADELRCYRDYFLNITDRYNLGIREAFTGKKRVSENVASLFTAGLSTISNTAAVGTVVFFLILLALNEMTEWRQKVTSVFEQQKAEKLLDTAGVVTHKLRIYLLMRTIISALSGFFSALWLGINGVDFAFVWGFLIFLLNYIPYIGSVVSVFPPSLMALVQFNIGKAIMVITGLTLIDQIIGNYIEPRLEGWTLVISPFVILISLVLWGWIWGIAGVLLAVPITIAIVAACDHISPLKPVARLLSRPKGYKHDE